MKKDRVWYLDYLRILATFAVVVIHVSAKWWYKADLGSPVWHISNVLNCAVRWAVPVFVMISGVLFLNRDIMIKTMYSKYIVRIVTALIFWAIVYELIDGTSLASIDFWKNVLFGHYHQWFLFMILGLYMATPILRRIVEDNEVLKYCIVLSIIFVFVLPSVFKIMEIFPEPYNKAGGILGNVIDKLSFQMVGGYVGYFLLGYCLDKIKLNKKGKFAIYIMGIIGCLSTICLTITFCLRYQQKQEFFLEYLTFNVLLESVAVFVLVKEKIIMCQISKYKAFVIEKISKYSFGAYLIHVLIMDRILKIVPGNMLTIETIILIPIISLVVLIISTLLSMLINQIPILNKYIV